ncbi:thioredoxin family protein [Sunxiuqinia sp. A32]|uniref:thioredoxin family protein n=1 Tax=Sunxiuqinia sp. A32 TaxID=3461496 RepID=UPI00404684F5
MDIKVLGPGCVRCRGLDHRVRKAVKELGIEASISKVEDLMEIMQFGIMQTPGLVVNNQVVMSGKLPTYTELKEILKNLKEE